MFLRYILHSHHKGNIKHHNYKTIQFKQDNKESTQLI